jgi:hypothetical protein
MSIFQLLYTLIESRITMAGGALRRAAFGCGLAAVLAHPAFAQAPPRVATASAVTREVSTDGFDDPAWQEASPSTGLTQQEPDESKPAVLRTECRVIATPRALLLRFTMEAPSGSLVARQLRRDADLTNDESVSLVLDTYRTGRNAYYFATNPEGVRVDGLVAEEGDPSLDWDAVWDVRTRRTAQGWQALFSIPFAALTFAGGTDPWGFNFERRTKRPPEIDRWSGWERPFGLTKISRAGRLAGIPPMPARRLTEAIPYAAAAAERLDRPPDTNLLGKAGGDFRDGISSAVEADATLNTDFAETEADDQQFNFGRASLLFPEKRQFFLQRSEVFQFGTPHTTFPFFSRSIGLVTDSRGITREVPIDAGVKLTGQLADTDFGALALQTRSVDQSPRADYYVARFKQGVGHASYVGALWTDIQRPGVDPAARYSRTAGADASLNLTPELNLSGYYARTVNPGLSGETAAWNIDLVYRSEYINGELQRSTVGSAFVPQMGRVNEPGIHFNFVDLSFTPRPQWGSLKNLSFETFYAPTYMENGELFEREYQYAFRAIWQSGAYTDDDPLDVFDENLTDPLHLTDSVAIPPGRYHFVRHQLSFGTDPTRPLAVQGLANFGGYYGGQRDGYTGRLDWFPSAHLGASLIEDYEVVRLPQGDFNLSLFSLRVEWNPSVSWNASAKIQSDNVERLTHVQFIVRWLVDPATDVFAVYERQVGAGFDRPGTRVTLKVRRTFDL